MEAVGSYANTIGNHAKIIAFEGLPPTSDNIPHPVDKESGALSKGPCVHADHTGSAEANCTSTDTDGPAMLTNGISEDETPLKLADAHIPSGPKARSVANCTDVSLGS